MAEVKNKNGPWLGGWAIAAGAGLVAGAACVVIGGFALSPAAFVGIVVALLVGLVLQWMQSAVPDRTVLAQPQHDEAAVPPPVATAAPAPVAAAPAPAPAPAAAPAPAPAVSAPLMTPAAPVAEARPAALSAPREGRADDLKIIKGIGPKLELLCHSLGFYHFDQVASWTPGEVAWVDENLEGFKGRVTRDRWVPQAQAIVRMGPEEFLRRLDAGEEF